MSKYVVDNCCAKIDKLALDKSYRNVFKLFCENENWMEVEFKLDGEIKGVTFADMEFVSEYCGEKIKKLLEGVPKGFVALKLANCPEWFGIFWGILIAGYNAFLVDARHDEKITQYFMEQSGAVAIISEEDFVYGDAKSIKASDIVELNKRNILKIAEEADKTSKTRDERINSYEWGDAVALCTSGTTSTAKIFVYDGKALGNQMCNAPLIMRENEYICNDSERKNLCFLPLNHIFGFMANYIWYGFFGSSMVVPDKIAPSVLLSTCRDHHVTNILGVPLLFNNIAKGLMQKVSKQSKFKQFMFKFMINLSIFAQRINTEFGIWLAKKMFGKSILSQLAGSDIQCLICGGGHVLPESLKIINGIGYYTICGFGMTEVGISSMEKRRGIKHRLAGGVGVPCETVEYKIVPFNDADNSAGELIMRGSSFHSAMLKDGKLAPPAYGEDGWFKTGDIGRLTNGALYIEGRLKEVIVNESGENVYPDELEDTFLNIDHVKLFSVLGLAKNGSKLYEDIAIICQVSEDDYANPEVIEKIREEIAKRNSTLPVYKKLAYALVTKDEMPLSNGIKIRRVILKKNAESGEGNFIKLDKLK